MKRRIANKIVKTTVREPIESMRYRRGTLNAAYGRKCPLRMVSIPMLSKDLEYAALQAFSLACAMEEVRWQLSGFLTHRPGDET